MEIYVVKPGDTIFTIAQNFGISINRLIHENALTTPYNLVQGQALIITFPSQSHTVKEGDTLSTIAETYGVSIMQLLRNNSFLNDRDYIYPGETLVISYNTNGSIVTNGYAYSYINHDTLRQTLPYLTYLSIFNYRVGEKGAIIKYGDDSKLLKLANDYAVTPLFMFSSLSTQGKPNLELVNEYLSNESYQETLNNNLVEIVLSSGYYGVNLLVSGINSTNQSLFINAWTKLAKMLKCNDLLLFLTINPNIQSSDGYITYEQLNYTAAGEVADGILFLPYTWAANPEEPGPIISYSLMNQFIHEVITSIPSNKILLGIPLIGYDWPQPSVPNSTMASSLTVNSCVILALDTDSIIQFDEASQVPFFTYKITLGDIQEHRIVWFMDVRIIDSLSNIILPLNLSGLGIWNIMVFNQPIWSTLTAKFDIVKLIPDNL